MGDTKTATEDCPCTRVHCDGTSIADCPTCEGTGTIDTDAITAESFAPSDEDDGWCLAAEMEAA